MGRLNLDENSIAYSQILSSIFDRDCRYKEKMAQ
jgi:hypothetical protein